MQEDFKKSLFLDKLHFYLYSASFVFVFVGLFILPKGHEIIELLVILSLFIGCLNCLINKKALVVVPKLWMSVLCIASLVIFVNHSIHGDWDRYGRAFLYLVFFVLFRPAIPKIKQVVFYSAAIGGILLGVLSICQFQAGTLRVEGFTNAILFSQGLFIILLFNVYFYLTTKGRVRYFSLISIVLLLVGLYLSQTRGVWLALIVLVSVYLFIKACKEPLKYLVLALALLLVALSTYEYSGFIRDKVSAGVADLQRAKQGQFSSSWGGRIVAWDSAVKNIQNYPLIGVGRDNFYATKEAQVERGEVHPAAVREDLYHAHNQYLQSQLIRGIPGTIALLLLLGYPWLRSGFFNNKDYLFKAISFTYAVYSLSDVPFEHLNTIYLYALSMTLLVYFNEQEESEEKG